MTVNIKGQEELMNFIKRQSEPEKLYDPTFKKVVAQNLRNLKARTRKDSGVTARAWKVKKNGLSNYSITNDVMTEDRKHLIAQILNKGRKAITPIKKKLLYIPLSEKGKTKQLGADIPKDFQLGIDYVFAKKAKAFKGTRYLDKFETDSLKYLLRSLMADITREISK